MMMMMMMIWICVYHTEKTIAVGDAICAFCDEYDKPEEQLECKKKMCSSVWDDFTKLLINIWRGLTKFWELVSNPFVFVYTIR